jgi:fructose-bisphosphate aldolase class II
VLHGASGVPQEFVTDINAFSGRMPGAVGIPDEELRHAAELAVCKVNVASDLRIAATASIRRFLAEHPEKFDPRDYLKIARSNMMELVRHKLRHVLGSAGKA